MKLEDKIAKALKKERNVLFAYLFGSFARGQARKDSDIDIAIFVKKIRKDPFYEMKLASKLENKIKKPFEVVILNDKPLTFIDQVLRNGKIIFSRDEKSRIGFESKMLNLCLDFQFLMDEYDKKRFERYGIR